MLSTLGTKRGRLVALLGSVSIMVALAAALIGPPMAVGQATRTWVSGVGDDVNPCSRTAPCKTFAGAISKTAAGGEINCLDPGGFGALTIIKSITIDCTGTLGGVLAASTTGMIVNGAGIVVTLRGLEINGGPPNLPGVNGVRVLQAASVHIFDTTIYNFLAAAPNGNGIVINNTSTTIEVEVVNSYIHNNGTATSGAGIMVVPTGTGAAKLTLDGVTLMNNFQGLRADTTGNTATPPAIRVVITGSTASSNTSHGFAAISNTGAIDMMIDSSTANYNGNSGVICSGAACLARIGRSTITGNGTGTNQLNGGVIQSYQTNQIHGNTNDGSRVDIAQE